MGWIGLDDTDSLEGGCTTWDFHKLLTLIEGLDYVQVKIPRLVRLWPFAPHRTRGNAALSCEIKLPEENIFEFIKFLDNWFSKTYSKDGDSLSESHPSLIWSNDQPPESWYWDSVRGYVNPDLRLQDIESLSHMKCWYRNSNRGIVGASSSIAWRGNNDWTWEATAWRERCKIGTKRMVSNSRVLGMSELFVDTILNRNPNMHKSLIAPRTPCPVLYGIRSETADSAKNAHNWLQEHDDVERAFSMRVHRSNQATDDHILGIAKGVVISKTTEVKGGHASISVFSNGRRETLVAFKQGGLVNTLLRESTAGDVVEWRGIKSIDGCVHLESLVVIDSVPRNLNRPKCICGNRLHRQGKGQPLLCSACGNTSFSYWLSDKFSGEGKWVQPPPEHRRHLTKPLNRQSKV